MGEGEQNDWLARLMNPSLNTNQLYSLGGSGGGSTGMETGIKPMPGMDAMSAGWEKDIMGAGKNPNGSGFGMNMPTFAAGAYGLGQLGQLYLGLQQLGLAKDSFNFQKQAYNKNLANQTASYNTQMKDRISGRNYATEDERKRAEAAALLPT